MRWNPTWRSATSHDVLRFVVPLALMGMMAGCDGTAPAAPQDVTAKELAARVEVLERVVPDQAHVMADVGYHFTNLWFAGKAENWPLADFYLSETKSHLHWAVRVKPVRKDRLGKDINLEPILEAFENSQLKELKQAIDKKDRTGFEAVYRSCLTICYSCHKASEKPYLRPQIPTTPEAGVINFDPKADWPL